MEQRLKVLDQFRAGLVKVLITTNVLSRGIDVEQVTIVVNFDLPVDLTGKADCETYLHRIGRTGRFGTIKNTCSIAFLSFKYILVFYSTGKSGIALNLVDSDQNMEICNSLERHFEKKIQRLDYENPDEIEKMQNEY